MGEKETFYVCITVIENGKRIEKEFQDVRKYTIKNEPNILKILSGNFKYVYNWDNVVSLSEKLE